MIYNCIMEFKEGCQLTTKELIATLALLSALTLAAGGSIIEYTKKAKETKDDYNARVEQRERELEIYSN